MEVVGSEERDMPMFVCGCSEKSRTEAEAALRAVFPKMKEGEERILTGERTHYRYEDQNGKVYEGERDEHRRMDLTETLLACLDELSQQRGTYFRFTVYTDQWCAVSVTEVKDKEEVTRWRAQYDYGLLPYALAMILLEIEKEGPMEDSLWRTEDDE
jgi:hypothetical protein